jgi:phage FluMu gp28-like protein
MTDQAKREEKLLKDQLKRDVESLPPEAPETMKRDFALIKLREYQKEPFLDRKAGIVIWFWSRQVGKSFTLACWIVDRMLSRPGRLVTVLSNSRDNGAELNQKVREICDLLGEAVEQEDLSIDLKYENMNMESRIVVDGKVSRCKVLAANPRTARGFSGDLILDEFAFHENGKAIWEAAEPILSSNPDYLCRIASTPNGTRNMFYIMVTSGLYKVVKVRRSDAYKQGLKIYHPVTRLPITPDEARAAAIDKTAYDQNYELKWANENSNLLTYELIGQAERDDVGVICEQEWSPAAIVALEKITNPTYVGIDVGRKKDVTVITVMEKIGSVYYVRVVLRLGDMRLPDQQRRIEKVMDLPMTRRCKVDMTGIGLGLCEYLQEKYGMTRVTGVNFSTSVPMHTKLAASGRKENQNVKVTEFMATDMLSIYEDKLIQHPYEVRLRDDLRLPEKVVSGNNVSIAASRSAEDHADHFWSFALAIYADRGGKSEFHHTKTKNQKMVGARQFKRKRRRRTGLRMAA